MKRKMIGAVFTAIVISVFNSPAIPCSCNETDPVEKAYEKAEVVFAGRCIGGKLVDTNKLFLNRYWNIEYKFLVEKRWNGKPKKEVVVFTGIGQGDCGNEFRIGNCYIVYAYKRDGVLETNICTRTLGTNVIFYDPIKTTDLAREEILALDNIALRRNN